VSFQVSCELLTHFLPLRYLFALIQLTNYLRPIQYIAYVFMINERLSILNQNMEKLKESVEKSRNDPEILSFIKINSMTSTNIFEAAENIRETFNHIWKLHQLINDCFGSSILIITVNAFFSAAFSIYFSATVNSGNISVALFQDPAIHSLHIAIIFIFLTNTCERSNQEAHKLSRSINELVDYNCPWQVREFTMQLKCHQQFIYTARGFFEIKSRLLYNVRRIRM